MATVIRVGAPEEERLGLFTEEMGETQQVLGKIQRHGMHSRSPVGPQGPDNQGLLELESGHVLASIDLLMARGTVDRKRVEESRVGKLRKLLRWLHWNENLVGVDDLLKDAQRELPTLGHFAQPTVDPLLMEVCEFLRRVENGGWADAEITTDAGSLCTKVAERMATRLGPYFSGLGREGGR